MIKNLEDLKQYNIICTNTDEVNECLDILKKLGFNTYEKEICCEERIVKYCVNNCFCSTQNVKTDYKDINFYQFKKQTKKFLKEIEEKEKVKEEVPDFEVASDGRIIKINNFESDKRVYLIEAGDVNCADEEYIYNFKPDFLKNYCKYGLIFSTKEVRDKMLEKQEIYLKLKNLAERLNKEQKNDWNNYNRKKYYIRYDYEDKEFLRDCNFTFRTLNNIYCSDENFLKIAKEEIGEDNLLKLFED